MSLKFKSFAALALSAAMMFSVAACGTTDSGDAKSDSKAKNTTVGYDVIKQISFNLLFLFSQGRLSLFSLGHRIIFIQPPAVHILLFAILVQIAEPIPPILALILAFSQNPIAIVSSFFTH